MTKLALALISPLLCPVVALFAGSAWADDNSSPNTSPTATAPITGHGHRGKGRSNSNGAKKSTSGTIRGTCSIIQSASNPIAGPCVNLLLILNDADGNEAYKDRTSPQGTFEFTGEPSKAYTIVPGSKYYDVVSPTDPVRGGDNVALQIRQK